MTTENLKTSDKNQIVNSYARFDVCIEKGKNATAYDNEGKKYIDFGSGIGVTSLGYCNKAWSDAVAKQAKTLQHTSNLYYNQNQINLATKLIEATGFNKVFFANSGAEANECAIKTARKYSFDKYGENRNKIVTLENSFHGRTITTLSATGQDHFHNYFFPFTEGFEYAKPNDIDDLKAKLDSSVCGLMIEVIQGEGGVMPLNAAYVVAAQALCKELDILFIIDEVQTGMSRTGKLLAFEHFGVNPDVVTLAKGLGGGLPIGAVLFNEKTSSVLGSGDHGTTFGGNPVVCAGALVVCDHIINDTFLNEVLEKGAYIKDKLKNFKHIKNVRGLGLMMGIELDDSVISAEVAKLCVKNGLLILTAKKLLRLMPPLTITKKEINQGLSILKDVLDKLD